ncbi:MAG: arsenite methyltransferase [Chloroflexota bacterium]
MTTETIHDMVRERYAAAAIQASEGCCAVDSEGIGPALYSALERDELPDAAVLASLGCGNPVAVAELHEGERVLDLGSGGGIDVLLSAKRVGPTGKAIGVDMTDEMLALARRNAAEAGVTNVEFRKGHIEAIPLPADSIDVVISNCVINLAADKPAVFREIARVLRPGGRMGISDIVAEDRLTADERAERGSYTGCIAGALSFDEFERGLADAGLVDVEITPTHLVADGMASCIIKAVKPGGDLTPAKARPAAAASKPRLSLAMLPIKGSDGSCCGGDGCC